MKTIAKLWAVCISVGVVLLTAFPSALLVDTGEWYSALILPPFALASNLVTPFWAIIYALDIIALSSLISNGVRGVSLYLPLTAGVLNVFWCYLFFSAHALLASALMLVFIALWRVACLFVNLSNKTAAVVFSLQTVWFGYLSVVAFAIFFLNR